MSPSVKGGIWDCFVFFINLINILNFFFVDILLFFIVKLTELKIFDLVHLLADKDLLAALLDFVKAVSLLAFRQYLCV